MPKEGTPDGFAVSVLAHKGEVIILFTTSVSNWFLAPQLARDIAQALIRQAELAEQQMDAEEGK